MTGGLRGSKTPYMTKDTYGPVEQKPNRIRLMTSPKTIVKSITNPDDVVGVDGKTELQKMMKKFTGGI